MTHPAARPGPGRGGARRALNRGSNGAADSALAESLGGGVHRHEAARVNEVGIGRLPLGVLHLETAAP